jgi:hypothetical protein
VIVELFSLTSYFSQLISCPSFVIFHLYVLISLVCHMVGQGERMECSNSRDQLSISVEIMVTSSC